MNQTPTSQPGDADDSGSESPATVPRTDAAETTYNPAPPPPAPQVTKTSNGIGIAGFVIALVGLVLCWIPVLGVILCTLGIVFSAIGLRNSNRHSAPHRGLSIAGLTVGIVMFLVSLLITVLIFVIAEEVIDCTEAWTDYVEAPVDSQAEAEAYERWLEC